MAAAPPARAEGASAPAAGAEAVAADLRMAEDAARFRASADAFVARAIAGDAEGARALLSSALVERSGEAAVRRALDDQILPFFKDASPAGRSVTVARTTDANGQAGFAFYMWLQPADRSAQRPFALYVVDEGGRLAVANVVPDRLVEGRHR